MYKAKPWTMMKADISRLVPTITRFVQRKEGRFVHLKCILFQHQCMQQKYKQTSREISVY